ncbi:MAG: pyrroline-5-carboxylate reductase [Rhodobacteraceae bacterium]|nr:pyrroline-5-carboxylate reductase [Paracoccaceae bacterium]
MQSRNQIFDDLTRLVTNALGLAQDASGEIENAIKNLLDRYLADHGLVTREEFDASQLMLKKAVEEITELRSVLEKLQKRSISGVSRAGSKISKKSEKPSL